MIFSKAKLIFLHVQKTGGNSISHVLLPNSDDEMTLRNHQDGINRFGVSGKLTRRKHAWLADYKNALGSQLSDYQVAISVRNPLDRAISMYFSPHRWVTEENGSWHQQTPHWDIERFENIISTMFCITDYLEVDGVLHVPDYLIRFENITSDLKKVATRIGIPFNESDLPHVNKSAASSDLHQVLKKDPQVQEMVKIRFAKDYSLLNSEVY
jgi:hypothetical protein